MSFTLSVILEALCKGLEREKSGQEHVDVLRQAVISTAAVH